MNTKMPPKKLDLSGSISNAHVTAYMDRIKLGLFLVLILISISEIITFFVINSGCLDFTMKNIFIKETLNKKLNSKQKIAIYLIFHNLKNWVIFGLFLFSYNKFSIVGKKIISCSAILLITTNYCFGHWGYIFLSIIYAVPIIFSCPLGKKYRLSVFLISVIMAIIYGYYQNYLIPSGYHLMIAGVNITILISTYVISSCIYESIVKAMIDIKEYSELSSNLYDEIIHDYSTRAFSKVALNKDIQNSNMFSSIAFIDVDNFKAINDNMGHRIGDNILITLVDCFMKNNELIYRYGGDEFIVLSSLNINELAKKIEVIKKNYISLCQEKFNCLSTFSVGINTMNKVNTIEEIETLLSESDKIMYISKNRGKNRITIGA